jgi:flagellar biosynthesis/type III secretory pathway M-ring protein FliF/YscJ
MGGGGGQLDMMVGEGDPSGMRVGDALAGGSQVLALAPEEQVHTYEVIAEAFDSNLESILHLAKSKPETVAVLIKSWTTEEKAGR